MDQKKFCNRVKAFLCLVKDEPMRVKRVEYTMQMINMIVKNKDARRRGEVFESSVISKLAVLLEDAATVDEREFFSNAILQMQSCDETPTLTSR